MHDIKLQLAGEGESRVEVRLTERRGDVFVAVRTPDSRLAGELRQDLPSLASRLEQAGYRIASDPQGAFYILQVNVLQVGQANPSALSAAMRSGCGGPVGGAVAGAAIARSVNTSHADLKGAAVGMAVEMIVGSLVKDVTYSIITDIRITERTDAPVTQKLESKLPQGTGTEIAQTGENTVNWRKYQTRVVSTANRVNLRFEQALPALEQQLARSIAGIL